MARTSDTPREQGDILLSNPKAIAILADDLSGPSRRTRQSAAGILVEIAKRGPETLKEHIPALIDALNRPEAQTRWECLDALGHLALSFPKECAAAFDGAETALFDEGSGILRLAAFRFLCAYGRVSEEASEQSWELLDEAIQCYHGDPEFLDMLAALAQFAEGAISASVREGIVARLSFDAKSGKGPLKRRAAQILEAVA